MHAEGQVLSYHSNARFCKSNIRWKCSRASTDGLRPNKCLQICVKIFGHICIGTDTSGSYLPLLETADRHALRPLRLAWVFALLPEGAALRRGRPGKTTRWTHFNGLLSGRDFPQGRYSAGYRRASSRVCLASPALGAIDCWLLGGKTWVLTVG